MFVFIKGENIKPLGICRPCGKTAGVSLAFSLHLHQRTQVLSFVARQPSHGILLPLFLNTAPSCWHLSPTQSRRSGVWGSEVKMGRHHCSICICLAPILSMPLRSAPCGRAPRKARRGRSQTSACMVRRFSVCYSPAACATPPHTPRTGILKDSHLALLLHKCGKLRSEDFK